jgi:uncharacterized protein
MISTNSYRSFKVRYLIGILLAATISTVGSMEIIGINNKDYYDKAIYIIPFLITCLWSLYYCQRLAINVSGLIRTETVKSVKWLELCYLEFMMLIFSSSFLFLFLISAVSVIPKEQILQDILAEKNGTIFQESFKLGSIHQNIFNGITVVVIGPICEEFLFRGIILNRWQEKWGTRKSFVFTTILFAAGHSFAPIPSLLGLLSGLVFLK